MRILYLLLFYAFFLSCTTMVQGQEAVNGELMTAVKRSVMTMKEMIDFEKSHPSIKNRKHKIPNEAYGEDEEENEIPPVYDIPKGASIFYDSTSYLYRAPTQTLATPAPTTNFNAVDDDNWIPPDVNGAVGPNHLMTTLNGQYRIQNRTGTTISSVTMLSFWSGFGLSDVFDPKILYDPFNGRWINIGIAQRSSAASSILVAVSATNDPTGTWYRYVIDATSTDTMWADYPSIGFNKNWIVVTANMFGNVGGVFQTGAAFVLNKANFYAGGSGQLTRIASGGNGFTICPAITFDTTTSTMYLIQTWNGNSGGSGYIRSYTLTGAIGSEVLTAGAFSSTNPWEGYGGGNFAPQSGTANRIDCDDDRMMQVVFRNNSLWAVHHVFLPINSPTRCSIQCWQLTTAGVITQHFLIDDATGVNFYAYPSIAVNYFNDILIGCSRFSSTTFPSACYSLRLHTDAVNTIQSPFVYKSGLASYNKTFGGSRNRWGDFTSTCVDPNNDNDFWTIQEYTLTSSAGTDRWGTWWANVAVQNTPVADFSASTTSACSNTNIIFTNNTAGTATSYSWNFGSGASPATSTIAGPVTVQYTTSGLKTITLTSTGPGGSNAKTKTNYINIQSTTPSVSISANPAGTICQGTSVTFTATPVNGGTTPAYQWKVNGTNAGINSSTFTTTTLTNGQVVTCVLTSNATCASPVTATSGGITMTVNTAVTPSVGISLTSGTNPTCSGSSLTFTAAPVNGGSTPSYQWKINGTNAGINSTTFTTSSLTNGQIITCTLTSNATCVSPATATSTGITMTINPIVAPSITILQTAGSNPACSGASLTFTATPVNGGATPAYQWKVNGSNAGSNSPGFTTSTLTNGQIVTCSLTSNASCLSITTASSPGITITINPLPTISGSLSVCAGSFTQLTGSPNAAAVNPWSSGNPAAASVSNSGIVTGLNAGTSVITYTNSNGCITTATEVISTCGLALNIKCFFEGYYLSNGTMAAAIDPVNLPSLCDTVKIELHNTTSPYNIVSSCPGVLSTSGTKSFQFPTSLIGQSFYIGVKHRNAIETWSAAPVLMNAVTSYDFTTAASKAFGNNQVNTSDNIYWAFYSGDIADANTNILGVQDGVIESVDYSYMESAVNIILTGYVEEDITGDGVVESLDYSILESNVNSIIFSMHP